MDSQPKTIAFICIGNACRSQMAEGLARAYGEENWRVFSAGSQPAGFVAAEAVEVMAERNIDISGQSSKGVDELPEITFDYVVTMGCGDQCPTLKAQNHLDWNLEDPIGRSKDFFRKIRDEIDARVKMLIQNGVD